MLAPEFVFFKILFLWDFKLIDLARWNELKFVTYNWYFVFEKQDHVILKFQKENI